jgi:hypothetical protein
MRLLFFYCACFALLFSCKNEPKKTIQAKEKIAPPTKYVLTPFAPSSGFSDAKIKSFYYMDGKFNFSIGGESYTLGEQTPDAASKMCANSAKGQHIHLILNQDPYIAKYVPQFEHAAPDGEHYLLAFLSRSYHESIKSLDAYVGLKAKMEGGAMVGSEPISGPTLFYSRPKGTYVGKTNTDKVMLDFYLLNATLGPDYKVKADINGEIHTISKWQPYYIEGLPMGENTIKLTLLDKDGKVVDNPINGVSRTFTLKADPIEG